MNDNIPEPLKSKGNLQYLQFIDLVTWAWERGHPDIPIVPEGGGANAKYPCIVYFQMVRSPHQGEPKPKIRQVTSVDTDTAVIVSGQRFDTIVAFSAVTETSYGGPRMAEEIIETFEAFMLEHTAAFKELGLSDLFYSRRIADNEDMRPGAGTVKRTVCYKITTETIIVSDYEKLKNIVVEARVFFEQEHFYFISASAYGNLIQIVGEWEFKIGDVVRIARRPGDYLPTGITTGTYVISNMVLSGSPETRKYVISKLNADGTFTLIDNLGLGSGYIAPVGTNVTVSIEDQNFGATPNF